MPTTSEKVADRTSLGKSRSNERAKETCSVSSPPKLDGRGLIGNWGFDMVTRLALRAGRVGPIRRALANHVERRIRAREGQPVTRHPLSVEQDVIGFGIALLATAERALARNQLGAPSLRALLRTLYCDVLVHRGDKDSAASFRARHGQAPPSFLVISPGKACNLRCQGCYANSGSHGEKLSWPVFERLVAEAYGKWGTRFFVISGGEPLAYKDQGKGVLDLAKRFPDCFFIMYSNGTLINDDVAKRMGKLGNVSPALSVEGMQPATDARRGDGVFDKVVAAMERLRGERVLFGISVTPTRKNAEDILGDDVVDFFFEKMGALYAFVFQYMPIGRAFTLELMLTPEQRLRLYDRVWSLIRERHFPMLDFWNSATASNGCVSAGRAGGYFHVNWNGDVSPCVFVPYAPKNINEVFERAGTLDELWADPFFADIRRWQREYGYRENHEHCNGVCGNWMAPCIIRDHYMEFMEIMRRHAHVRPTDDDARAALEDPDYHAGLVRFDRDYETLTGPRWRKEYLHGRGVPPAPMKRV